jgi:hypothetical protein
MTRVRRLQHIAFTEKFQPDSLFVTTRRPRRAIHRLVVTGDHELPATERVNGNAVVYWFRGTSGDKRGFGGHSPLPHLEN